MPEFHDGWESWSKYVIKSIEKLESKVDSMESQMHQDKLDIKEDIITLKTKASFWGSVSGIIVSAVISILVGVIVYNINTKQTTITSINTEYSEPQNLNEKVKYEPSETFVKK